MHYMNLVLPHIPFITLTSFCRAMATTSKCKIYTKKRAQIPTFDEHPYMAKICTK